MLKAIIILILFGFSYGCDTEHYPSDILIVDIDQSSLTNHYFIKALKEGKEIGILSKKEKANSCNTRIVKGQIYNISLVKVFVLPVDDSLNMRLYQNGINVDDKLIVDKDTEVYRSDNLQDLCYEAHKE